MAKKRFEYQKEFFDRDYTAKEAYGRVWNYARRYRVRLVFGVLFGMLTAGTLLPLYQIIQPVLARAEAPAAEVVGDGGRGATRPTTPNAGTATDPDSGLGRAPNAGTATDSDSGLGRAPNAGTATDSDSGFGRARHSVTAASPKPTASEKEAAKLTGEFGKFRSFAKKLGFDVQSEDDALGLPLVLAVILVVPLFALARCAFVFMNHYFLAWAAMRTVRDIRCDILRHVQAQSMQFFGRIDVGQLMTRSTTDPQQVQQIVQQVLQEVAQAPFEILVSVGFIIWSAIENHMMPTLGLIIVGFPLFMCPVVFLSKRIRKWSRKALERFSLVGSRIHEILTCIKVVKAYDTAEYENRRYEAANNETLKATMRALRWGLFVGPAVEGVGILLIGVFILWCFAMHVKLSAIIPMLAPLLIIYRPLKQLSRLQVQIEQGRAALARIWSILDVKMELAERPNAPAKTTFDEALVFDDVSFRYDTAERDAVSHASFAVRRGAFVAVVGGTGSGKSTMSALLARFFDPREGKITLDGHDLRDLRIADLRRLIGSVQQETLLFNDTIEANIKYGSPKATHEEVVAAAKMANAHDFILSQPGGYGRLAGEKGFALSGGERQRIAIARAILKNPPILILDEATSALDTVTERLVQDAINNLMKDRTTFAIAHRLSTIRAADLILVMREGVIVERGTHDELYAAGGVYRRLCDMQNQR